MTNAMLFICWELLPMLTESSSSFDNHKGQTSHFFYPRFWHSLWLTKVHLVKALLFPVVNVCMWELDHNESWAPKNWCFWTVVVEKTLEIWTARISNQSILKEISLEYSLEGPMLKLKLQYFCYLMWRASRLIRKDPDAGKDWRQEEKGMTENEMAGWHHQLNGLEFE